MENKNIMDLRWELEQMASQQLQDMLQSEVEKEIPDDDLVLQILHILEKRNADKPAELGSKSEVAWMQYQERVNKRAKQSFGGWSRILKAASIVVIIGLLFAVVPQQVQAESFWDKLVRWTESVVEFFSPKDNEGRILEYEFKTDNPGLQEVYDAVVETGVSDPVVPMWLPEGYELTRCVVQKTPVKKRVYSVFYDGNNEITFAVDLYLEDVSHNYHKDDSSVEIKEIEGRYHTIMRNNDVWVAIWTAGNVECSIAIDCQEDTLLRILRSIYVMEDIL